MAERAAPEGRGSGDDFGLYVHVPFCARRCHFCAFYLVIQEKQRINRFVEDVKRELATWAIREECLNRKVATVYFGGGTPTILSPEVLSEILESIFAKWEPVPDPEITVESTPESLRQGYPAALTKLGVTRLSMGVQSFDPVERKHLGLDPDSGQIGPTVLEARNAGMDNINLDLMYGIPGQSLASWETTLEQALELSPTHLSCYALTLEEGTRLYQQWKRGTTNLPDQKVEENFQRVAEERLFQNNFARYEISNWAQPGYACRHNLRYWQGQDYLGIGPSAQSYMHGIRWGNVSDLHQYSQQLAQTGLSVDAREVLRPEVQRKERVIFGLRKMEGVPVEWVNCLADDHVWVQTFRKLLAQRYVRRSSGRYRLTAKGRCFADSVGEELW